MKQRNFIKPLIVLILIASTACTPSSSTSPTGSCANPLYPVIKGATWTYTTTGSPAGDFNYTDIITDSRIDGFTLTSQFQNITRTQEWSCRTEGLLALQPGNDSAGLSAADLNAHFDTINVSGVTIPANVQPGAQWQYSLDLKGQSVLQNGQTSESTNSVSLNAQAVDTESITVPAGKFDAIKVQVNATLQVTAILQGTSIPFTVTSSSTRWYAPGVGWVKTIEQSNFGNSPNTSTTELVSYKIP